MKILMVSTISDTVNTFLVPHIRMLVSSGAHVDVAFNIQQEVSSELNELESKIYNIPFSRFVKENNFISTIRYLRNIIIKEDYDIVHTHTPIASAIVRIACINLPNTQVYYTAHGFHFYKGSSKKNWVIFYTIEKFLSRFTDKLITINHEDYQVSKSFHAKETIYVPGVGIDLEKFKNSNIIDTNYIRDELDIKDNDFVILSIGELNKNKNHRVVLEAIAKLNNKKISYIIAGEGELKSSLKDLSKKLEIEDQIHFLGYRKDIKSLLKFSDLFIFPSYREGLSVSVMEAMAMGKPIVLSNIRGNIDLVDHKRGGFTFNPESATELSTLISSFLDNPKLCYQFGKYNENKIKTFSLENVLLKIKRIYSI